ncbi:MAG: flagellar hook-basal body complex protein, partial [Desulfovibrionaceae bacterium]|nr:flagellar hook-basal body complex protein [Desulfovibrionaceae bacterium]
MSLTASMWTGVSGLLAHGEKMNVVGNNIANVSTVGFKGQRMDFADFVYQNSFSSAGVTQIGRGVKIGAVMGNFSTGPMETTTEATDLAISGRGFFKVKKTGSDQAFYTRAGNFRFNYEGYLMDPNGLAVQGWKVDNRGGVTQAAGGMTSTTEEKKSDIIGSGVPMDVKLDTWTVAPQQTTKITFKSQLPNKGSDNARDSTNPFAALFQIWDGTQPPATASTPPIAESSYGYQTTMDVYDEAGTKHKITIYYDRVSPDDYQSDPSRDIWEYMVTMDPAEDQRMFADTTTTPPTLRRVNETKAGGILMSGTMTFNSGGQIIRQSAYTWGGSDNPTDNPAAYSHVAAPPEPGNPVKGITLDPADLDNWKPATVSRNGYPLVVA